MTLQAVRRSVAPRLVQSVGNPVQVFGIHTVKNLGGLVRADEQRRRGGLCSAASRCRLSGRRIRQFHELDCHFFYNATLDKNFGLPNKRCPSPLFAVGGTKPANSSTRCWDSWPPSKLTVKLVSAQAVTDVRSARPPQF